MKKIRIISFTRQGYLLSIEMKKILEEMMKRDELSFGFPMDEADCTKSWKKNNLQGKKDTLQPPCILYTKKDSVAREFGEAVYVCESLGDWCASVFYDADALIFIGASGIAVRTIAPFLKSKVSDPAVLVADESGIHIISLLSGHLGGGNRLTEILAKELGSDPVITTASDVNKKTAVDVWAQKNHLVITDLKLIKRIAADIVEGKKVGIYWEGNISGEIPEEFLLLKNKEAGENPSENLIFVSAFLKKETESSHVLQLIPRNVILGIGCKKGKTYEEIREVVDAIVKEQGISLKSIGMMASIDLKQKETGLLALAKNLQIPFRTYSAEELQMVPGEYRPSAFVSEITGVDNVCERAAMAALTEAEQKKANFICRKTAKNGVTVALLEKEKRLII